MACGEQMALTAATPADDVAVPGFQQQLFTCSACGSTERRLMFAPTKAKASTAKASTMDPVPAKTPAANQAITAPAAPEATPSAEADGAREPPCASPERSGIAPATSWVRAMEKLRSRQADLMQRTPWSERAHWNAQFEKAWERLGPERRLPAGSRNSAPVNAIGSNSARAVRARLRKITARPNGSHNGNGAAAEPAGTERDAFQQFWDSLIPAPNPPDPAPEKPCEPQSLLPLPRELSLVPIGTLQAASMQSLAIFLLQGRPGLDA
jgi:hypothetical protein